MKNCFSLTLIVLMGLLAVAITGCDEEIADQMDRIIDTDPDTPPPAETQPPPPEPTTPKPETVTPLPAGTVVFVEPRQTTSPAPGQQLRARINIKGADDVLAYEATVGFDPTALRYVSIENADYLPVGAFASPPQVTANSVYLAAVSVSGPVGAASGTLAIVTFEVISAKASTITLNDVLLSDSNATAIASTSVDGKVSAP